MLPFHLSTPINQFSVGARPRNSKERSCRYSDWSDELFIAHSEIQLIPYPERKINCDLKTWHLFQGNILVNLFFAHVKHSPTENKIERERTQTTNYNVNKWLDNSGFSCKIESVRN